MRCFPRGSSADRTLSPHSTRLCRHSKTSWLWSALRKQLSNRSFCAADFIIFLRKCLIESSACDYQLWPKAACTSIVGIWNIFLVILWPRVNAQAHLVCSRFVYMDRWPVVHNHGPENPFLSFSRTVLNLQLHLFFLNIHCGVSPQTSFHFLMSESDRALRSSWRQSLASLKEAQGLALLF